MLDLAPPPTISVQGVLLAPPKEPRRALVAGELSEVELMSYQQIKRYELRFGIAFLYELDYLYPQLVIDDFARRHHGEAGIDFMLREGDAFPRADVIGVRQSTGLTDQVFMKQVDLASNLRCFALDVFNTLTKLDFIIWVDPSFEVWQYLSESDLRANPLMRYSMECRGTNLHDLEYIAEKFVKNG